MNNTTIQVTCMLCKKAPDHYAVKDVFEDPELCSLLAITTGCTIEQNPALSGVVCGNCLMATNLQLEYRHRVQMNMLRMQINYHRHIQDMRKVAELQTIIKDFKLKIFKQRRT